jgi:glycosyltransferase involved in cell wall biosynthesis
MKSTSKVNKIYLFNAYSLNNSNEVFISGSDRVGLELIKQDPSNTVVFAPNCFKPLLPQGCIFVTTQDVITKSLVLNYLYRTVKSIQLLKKYAQGGNYIISTSDFFCDTIPAFMFSGVLKWYAFTYHLYPSVIRNFSLRNLFGNLAQAFSFFLFKRANLVITTNLNSVNYLKYFYNIRNVLKIKLGIGLDKYLSSNKDRPVDLIFLGRIKNSKGIFELPELISQVAKSVDNLRVEIVGNGDLQDLEKLENLITKFQINRYIKISTGLNDNEVTARLKQSKYLVQLSREEGFGLVILEALASGCQVLGYNLPVYLENFSEFNLKMIENFNQKNLSLLIIDSLNNYQFKSSDKRKFVDFEWGSIYNSIFNN